MYVIKCNYNFYHGKPIKKSCELGIKYVNQAIRSNLVTERVWSN